MTRGRHPDDEALFAEARVPVLRAAVADLGWLRERGYADGAALTLVGDRYQLPARARLAVGRAAAAPGAVAARRGRRVEVAAVAGRALAIDAWNVLVTCEAALAGGVVLVGADGAWRDLSAVHGGYRAVPETERALAALAAVVAAARPAAVTWYVDRPVSASGELAGRLRAIDPAWQVAVVDAADPAIVADATAVAASSDAWILDRAAAWVELPQAAVAALGAAAWVVSLAGDG